jgi:hypothetical protein
MLCHSGREVPDADITIAASADESIAVRDHSPDTHDVSLQTSQMASFTIENMNLCVVERNDDIFIG